MGLRRSPREVQAGCLVVTDAYLTVADPATVAFSVQGSEFLGHVRPVESVEAAESFVETITEEYADATHNVPAYRVRVDPGEPFLREYASDEGEPSGSAGKPALSVLQSQDVENVAVVVTRYYGGTNLGVGGLVRAYSRAVTEAVEAAGICERQPHDRLRVVVDYDDSGTVRGILESEDVGFEADYATTVTFSVRVPVTDRGALTDRLRSATSGRAEIEVD